MEEREERSGGGFWRHGDQPPRFHNPSVEWVGEKGEELENAAGPPPQHSEVPG